MSPALRLPQPSWSMVLGFGDHEAGALDRTRRLQAAELARTRPLALALHLAVGAMMVLAMAPVVPADLLAIWSTMMVLVTGTSLWDIGRRAPPGWAAPHRLLARSAANSFVLGLLWVVPLAVFSRWAGMREIALLGILVPGMMAGAATLMASAPASAAAFNATLGVGAIILLGRLGSAFPASLAALGTALLLVSGLRHARALMQRRGMEMVLAERDELVSLLLHEHGDGADWLWRTDAARALVSVGPRLAGRLRRPAELLEGRPLIEALGGAGEQGDGPLRDLADRLHRRTSFADLELPIRVGDETRWWSLSAVPRHDEAGQFLGFQGKASDITERRRSTDRIERLARHDSLTGLANRRQLLDVLAEALTSGHTAGARTALMIVDLDRFKQVNDTLGHPVGDVLLRMVGERLTEVCDSRGVPGRLGGDEFAVVVRDADATLIDRLAGDIVDALTPAFIVDGHQLHVGASIGSATAPLDGRSAETLVRHADLALYRAKGEGRGLHRRYDHQLSARADERREMEAALREALERDELSLVYQPIIAAGDARIEAFEAYLRWSHPELGELPAERFVPLAEEAGLMGRIGDWVIRTACREAASWPDPTRLSLNLSPAQLHDPQLAATLVSALSASGLEPARLELEIAEGVLLRPGAQAQPALDRLGGIGVTLALGHFGRGHAALAYLRGARFSSIKLDRSFVADVGRDAADSVAMIRAVVAMADGLGMTVTAEGTETEREYEMVRRLGCDRAQGYLFGRPVAAADARRLAGAAAERRAA